MKSGKFIGLVLGAVFVACTSQSEQSGIGGRLEGIESGAVIIRTVSFDHPERVKSDTVQMEKDRFVYLQPSDSVVKKLLVMPKIVFDGVHAMPLIQPVEVVVFPGDRVKLDGSIGNCRISGSRFYEAYNAFMDSCDGLPADSLLQHKLWYVRNHPDEVLSLYLLGQVPDGKVGEMLPLLSSSLRRGAVAPMYRSLEKCVEEWSVRSQMQGKIQFGNSAPAFSLKALDGSMFSLSSLRGKYVVLDFWGSWCGWCIKGFSDMKKMYSQYKDRLEIVGIACRDTESLWKEAVRKYGLPWTNVLNGTPDNVPPLYAVEGYPTKVVVGPEGNILNVSVGESAEFYEYVDSLFLE